MQKEYMEVKMFTDVEHNTFSHVEVCSYIVHYETRALQSPRVLEDQVPEEKN